MRFTKSTLLTPATVLGDYFCAVAAKSNDSNAYGIVVTGGRAAEQRRAVKAEALVITVHGFHWFRGPSPNSVAQIRRRNSRALLPLPVAARRTGGRQMIAVHGISETGQAYHKHTRLEGPGHDGAVVER